MTFLNLCDYALGGAQAIVAFLLWHRAEPRLRIVRGQWQASCAMLLGFVLAWGVVLSLSRPLHPAPDLDWQRSLRDLFLVLYALCLYHRAMTLEPLEEAGDG